VDHSPHKWKPFKLSSIRDCWRLPTGQRVEPSEIVLHWYAMLCENILIDWRYELKRSAIVRAIQRNQQDMMNHGYGRSKQRGRKNSQRRCPRISVCSTG
jgi:hypothetical protein